MTQNQSITALISVLVLLLIVLIVTKLRRDAGSVNPVVQRKGGTTPRPQATTVLRQIRPQAPKATTKSKTPSQCFVQVEAPRRPSNREMRVLLDFVNDIYNAQGVDIYEGMHKFTNEIHTAWKNAREGSQFIFNIPYAGKKNLFLRRRKHTPNKPDGAVEARHCASNIYWVLKHK